jgi:hypothetical protein
LVRHKIRRKESYIIPNVEKIEKIFAEKNISDLLDDELVPYKLKGPIPQDKYPKEKDFVTLSSGIILPWDPNGSEHKVYSVCYYYENGDPVFVDGSGFDTNEKDPMPFYEDKSRYRSISAE